ncbi:uncharacterized protein LOC135216558 [Macrobrachium nipponense]|uniref:uncharacterized protein LOC135216558 n=1 Tax=Macrobrachium nipponense TaxID=159736 RepID=UPI0030C7BDD8
MLTRCCQYDITLNKDKFTLAAPKVNFCGYVLSSNGIAADPNKVSTIHDFPIPSNVTDLRSFMGLVNQLADFTPDIAAAVQPLHPLMSPIPSFIWTPDHKQAFKKVKTALTLPPVLAPFNPALLVVLQTDASSLYGLSYALLERQWPWSDAPRPVWFSFPDGHRHSLRNHIARTTCSYLGHG